jgi:hypothetical protein
VNKRLTTMCHLWPAIAPHGAEVPNSVWNLRYGVWMGFARAADQYNEEASK